MKVIEAYELTVRYGAKQVLAGLSLEVQHGTICALLGPNGAGKTTLIRTLVNILQPYSGSSALFGVPSTELSPAEFRRIGYVSENQELPLWMKVAEFFDYCAGFYGAWDQEWCRRKTAEFDLPPRERLDRLSRGMRMKAALISALSYHPELLILDEPFSGLDPLTRDDLLDLVIELTAEMQATALISSHDLSEVERLSDSVAFLLEGKIAAHAALDDLVREHQTDLKGIYRKLAGKKAD